MTKKTTIKALLKEKNMDIYEFRSLSGVSYETIVNVWDGEYDRSTVNSLQKICDALGAKLHLYITK
ncbi:MAG: helix-turn-helix transcriptional regulator [Flavobacteriales bacterium]|nr:helix-turn-helix transcriptional regulator [Flavobacteriales bacterium]